MIGSLNPSFVWPFQPECPDPDPDAALAAGLVADWAMCEGAGATAYNRWTAGTDLGAHSTTWAAGNNGRCLSFDGSSSYGLAPHHAAYSLSSNFSLAAWFRPAAVGDGYHGIMCKSDGTLVNWHMVLNSTDGKIAFYNYNGTQAGAPVFSPLLPTAGAWNLGVIAVAGSATTFWLFCNGVLSSYAGTNTTTVTTNTGPVVVGCYNGNGGGGNTPANFQQWFEGPIQAPRVWARTLTLADVVRLIGDYWAPYRAPSSRRSAWTPSPQPINGGVQIGGSNPPASYSASLSSSGGAKVGGAGAVGQPNTSLVYDTFTDTAGTELSAHTPDIGGAWVNFIYPRNTTSDPLGITAAGRIRPTEPPSSISQGWYYNTTSPPTPDYFVSADLYVASLQTEVYLFGRLGANSVSQSWYAARYSSANARWSIEKRNDPNSTSQTALVTSSATLTVGNTYHAELRLTGTAIELWVGGSALLSVSDSEITAAGYGGVFIQDASGVTPSDSVGIHVDNLRVYVPYSARSTGGIQAGGSNTPAATWSPVPTGGVEAGGSTSPALSYAPVPTGGAQAGGSSPGVFVVNVTAGGGAELGGTSIPGGTFTGLTQGGAKVGGTNVATPTFAPTHGGGAELGGTNAAGLTFGTLPGGGAQLGGSNTPAATWSPVPTGGAQAGGSSPGVFVVNVTAGGGAELGGSNPGVLGFAPVPGGGVEVGGTNAPAWSLSAATSGGVEVGGTNAPAWVATGLAHGGAQLGGTAAPGTTLSPVPAGGIELGGSGTPSFSPSAVPAGGIGVGGSSPGLLGYVAVVGGGAQLGGTSATTWATSARTSGGVEVGGSNVGTPTWSPVPTGGAELGGTAAPSIGAQASSSGGAQVGGSSPGRFAIAFNASGGVELGGTSVPGWTAQAVASGGVELGGANPPAWTAQGLSGGGGRLGGANTPAASWATTAGGGAELGGANAAQASFPASGSGGVELGGSSAPAWSIAGATAGGIRSGGSAPGTFVAQIAAAGGLQLGGTSVVAMPRLGEDGIAVPVRLDVFGSTVVTVPSSIDSFVTTAAIAVPATLDTFTSPKRTVPNE